jgi:hypothetical protein
MVRAGDGSVGGEEVVGLSEPFVSGCKNFPAALGYSQVYFFGGGLGGNEHGVRIRVGQLVGGLVEQ